MHVLDHAHRAFKHFRFLLDIWTFDFTKTLLPSYYIHSVATNQSSLHTHTNHHVSLCRSRNVSHKAR